MGVTKMHARQVFKSLAKFEPHLKNRPHMFNKHWVSDRVTALLQPLMDGGVDSRLKLLARWKSEPSCASVARVRRR